MSRPSGASDLPEGASRAYPARFASLASIDAFVHARAVAAGLDDKAVYQIEMAVDEACSNIIEHAYGGESDSKIECACVETSTALVVILKDRGAPFDPGLIAHPDIHAPLEKRESHGLGLHFIRSWVDQVTFDFSPAGGNTLTLVKKKRKNPGGPR